MTEFNELQAREFLKRNNIPNCTIAKVAGDASFRSYYRIFSGEKYGEKKWILMFAPPSLEDIIPFIQIDRLLLTNGFSAPEIFAIDEEIGFILLEDFGDDTYSRVLAREEAGKVELELELYKKACDCLIEIHKLEVPQDLPQDLLFYDEELLLKEVSLFTDWYLPFKEISITQKEKEHIKDAWIDLFSQISKENQVLVLRDYHADNLMTLPQKKYQEESHRESHRQVGLLDFQDAVIGSKAYDLVSLLEDARRDLDEENRQKLFDYYLEKSGCDKVSFLKDYEILSLQRNIKIIGIFSRLSIRDGKDNYLILLPRVLNFIKKRVSSENTTFLQISNLLENLI